MHLHPTVERSINEYMTENLEAVPDLYLNPGIHPLGGLSIAEHCIKAIEANGFAVVPSASIVKAPVPVIPASARALAEQAEIPTEFTPGPWCEGEVTIWSGDPLHKDSRKIAISLEPSGEQYSRQECANRALIAQAPELYALLAEFYDATWDAGDYSLPLTLRDRALAALKRARGEA
jgi:hypothetical protein